MELCNKILSNEKYKELVLTLEKEEADREFCKHNMEHFLNVARIAYIESLERNIGVSKELIYATALLHDIGRCSKYKSYDSHDEAGAHVATEILEECGCGKDVVSLVVEAIFNHGNAYIAGQDNLCGLIYRADKLSRNCYICKTYAECNWSDSKKNHGIVR